MQLVCDANIKMDLPNWVMGGANNSKWGDENNILHTPALSFLSVSLSYWMGENNGEGGEWDICQEEAVYGASAVQQYESPGWPLLRKSGYPWGESLTFALRMQNKGRLLIAVSPGPLYWQWGFFYSPVLSTLVHWGCIANVCSYIRFV